MQSRRRPVKIGGRFPTPGGSHGLGHDDHRAGPGQVRDGRLRHGRRDPAARVPHAGHDAGGRARPPRRPLREPKARRGSSHAPGRRVLPMFKSNDARRDRPVGPTRASSPRASKNWFWEVHPEAASATIRKSPPLAREGPSGREGGNRCPHVRKTRHNRSQCPRRGWVGPRGSANLMVGGQNGVAEPGSAAVRQTREDSGRTGRRGSREVLSPRLSLTATRPGQWHRGRGDDPVPGRGEARGPVPDQKGRGRGLRGRPRKPLSVTWAAERLRSAASTLCVLEEVGLGDAGRARRRGVRRRRGLDGVRRTSTPFARSEIGV